MDFQRYLQDTYFMLKRQPLVFILGGFIAQLATLLSFGLLSGPIQGAYQLMMIHYLRDGNQPKFNDLLAGFQRLGALLPFFFLALLILIGFAFLIIPGLLFAAWWIYTLPLMIDKKMALLPAMRASYEKVNEKGVFMHVVFVIMITVIPFVLLNFLAAIIPLFKLLQILVPPLQTGCLAGLYLDQFDGDVPTNGTDEERPSPRSASRQHLPTNGANQTRPLPGEKYTGNGWVSCQKS